MRSRNAVPLGGALIEVVALVLSGLSVLIAGVALWQSKKTAKTQSAIEAESVNGDILLQIHELGLTLLRTQERLISYSESATDAGELALADEAQAVAKIGMQVQLHCIALRRHFRDQSQHPRLGQLHQSLASLRSSLSAALVVSGELPESIDAGSLESVRLIYTGLDERLGLGGGTS